MDFEWHDRYKLTERTSSQFPVVQLDSFLIERTIWKSHLLKGQWWATGMEDRQIEKITQKCVSINRVSFHSRTAFNG